MDEIRKIIELGKPFGIKVITRSSSDSIHLENGIIKVKIREIPEDGKANRAIIDLFSRTFKIPKSHMEIIKGSKSSNKILSIRKIHGN